MALPTETKYDWTDCVDIEDIKNFPAADVEPVRQWIRADVREPEADEYVLAIVSGEPTPHEVLENGYALAMVTDEGWQLPEWPEWRGAEVLYWMPLPEPPEEGGCKK